MSGFDYFFHREQRSYPYFAPPIYERKASTSTPAHKALANGELSVHAKRVLSAFLNRPELRMSMSEIERHMQMKHEFVKQAVDELVVGGHLVVVGSTEKTFLDVFGRP